MLKDISKQIKGKFFLKIRRVFWINQLASQFLFYIDLIKLAKKNGLLCKVIIPVYIVKKSISESFFLVTSFRVSVLTVDLTLLSESLTVMSGQTCSCKTKYSAENKKWYIKYITKNIHPLPWLNKCLVIEEDA